MTGIGLVCVATAVALSGPVRTARRPRFAGTTDERVRRRPAVETLAGRSRTLTATAAVVGAGLAGPTSLLVGGGGATAAMATAAGGIAGSIVGRVLVATAEARHGGHVRRASVEAVATLAAEIRAGQTPTAALRVAAGASDSAVVATVFGSAATAAERDADVGAALRAAAGGDRARRSERIRDGTGESAWALAAAWRVTERSGAAPASVLDRVVDDLRARHRHRQQLEAQLAGARSTAAVLAVLPLLGVGLGIGMGARPVQVLFGTPTGGALLLIGVVLEAVGVLWTAAIVRAAGGTR